MKEHMASALEVARFLESHPAVEQVLYPGECYSVFSIVAIRDIWLVYSLGCVDQVWSHIPVIVLREDSGLVVAAYYHSTLKAA